MDRPSLARAAPLVAQAAALAAQAAPSAPRAAAPVASRPAAPEDFQTKRRAFEDSLKEPFIPIDVPGLVAIHQSMWQDTIPFVYEKRHKNLVMAFQQYIRDFPADYAGFLLNLGHP